MVMLIEYERNKNIRYNAIIIILVIKHVWFLWSNLSIERLTCFCTHFVLIYSYRKLRNFFCNIKTYTQDMWSFCTHYTLSWYIPTESYVICYVITKHKHVTCKRRFQFKCQILITGIKFTDPQKWSSTIDVLHFSLESR